MLVSRVIPRIKNIAAHKARIGVIRILLASFERAVEYGVFLLMSLLSVDVYELIEVQLRTLFCRTDRIHEGDSALDKRGAALHNQLNLLVNYSAIKSS